MAGNIVDVRTRRNTDSAHLRCKGIRQVVTVQIQCRDDIKISWAGQHLLQSDVSDRILDKNFAAIQSILLCLVGSFSSGLFFNSVVLCPCEHFIAKFLFRHFVTPVLEGSFRELHNVAFVHKRYALTLVFDRVFNRGTNETLRAFCSYRLNSDTGSFRETDFAYAHFILKERKHFLHFF
ncbi:hypothetical protein D3C77_565030 [compost metagenome]